MESNRAKRVRSRHKRGKASASAAVWSFACCAIFGASAQQAQAQVSDKPFLANDQKWYQGVLADPALPDGFDRGRNVAVTDEPRPDYDPVGVNIGSFTALPSLTSGVGATSNAFLTPKGEGSGYLDFSPSLNVNSDWSRNYLKLRAMGNFERYFSTPDRNQNSFDFGSLGRLDVNTAIQITGEAQFSQLYENPESGAIAADLAVLSHYQRNYLRALGSYEAGQVRVLLALDRTGYNFAPITQTDGTQTSQASRDRSVVRPVLQLQYAITPSVIFFTQGEYARTRYEHTLAAAPLQSSNSYRFLGGINLDLAGLMRGELGIGYTRRDYDASYYYTNAQGFSAEGKLQFFPSPLTTLTLQVGRTLEDSSIASEINPYFLNRLALKVDHELLINLLLNAEASYSKFQYVNEASGSDISSYGFSAGARYLVSHKISLKASLDYNQRDSYVGGNGYNEFRGLLSIIFSR